MGLFDWLFSRNRHDRNRRDRNRNVLPDRIWLTDDAKANGIRADAVGQFRLPAPPTAVVLAAHFEESLAPLERIAGEFEGHPVHVLHAERIVERFESTVERDESQTVVVIVDERHPLRRHDDRIVDLAASLPCRVRVAFHLSLEGPLLRLFVSDWVGEMLRKMGMAEKERIESRLVARKIEGAQRRIEFEAGGDEPAGSFHEWIRRNAPRHADKLELEPPTAR